MMPARYYAREQAAGGQEGREYPRVHRRRFRDGFLDETAPDLQSRKRETERNGDYSALDLLHAEYSFVRICRS